MSRIVRRVFVGGALVASLVFVSPAEAAGRSRWTGNALGLFEQAWQWVTGVLGGTRPEKQGAAIDPDGTPASGTTGNSCAECDRGGGIDPDG